MTWTVVGDGFARVAFEARRGASPILSHFPMRILQCHNLYQQAGGEDRVAEDERQQLESRGHTVIPYVKHNDAIDGMGKLTLAGKTIWNRQTIRELEQLIAEHKPDVAHFHNTMPLISPAAYHACRGAGVPVVQTLHNYRLLCPKATFFRDNRLCEDCLHKRVKWPAVKHACYRDSRSASAVMTTMLTVHGLADTYRNQVDAYITCSEFTREKMIEGGYPAELLHYKPNFLTIDPPVSPGGGSYALYVGRLVLDKGMQVLADAWDQLDGVELQVIGKGPEEGIIDALAARKQQVTRHGWLTPEQVAERLDGAAFLVLPTLNYEGFPKVIVEAYAHGIPVVATNLGAMKSVVADGVTGRHVKYNDPSDLARVVRELIDDPDQVRRLGEGARRAFEQHYTAEATYQPLLDVYAIARQRFVRSGRALSS